MKFIFTSLAVLGLASASSASLAAGSASGGDGGDPQRLVTILDYIGSDYAGAVSAGVVVSELEYAEQRSFIATAVELTAGMTRAPSDPLARRLAAIAARIEAKADAAEIATLCREAREEVVGRFRLATAPAGGLSLETARALYAQACAQCHGATGDGETALAATLDPRPASFKDAERLTVLSPYRVFNTLTFGVPGTGMASYEALSPAERWSLAFYVFRLAHRENRAEPSTAVAIDELARLSDGELRGRLAQAVSPPQVDAALAFLRSEAPFREAPAAGGLGLARGFLNRAVTAYREGRTGEAQRALVDAYLQGFEPLEPKLVARDPRAVAAVESGFGALRASLAKRVAPAAFAGQVEDLARTLDRADSARRPAVAPLVSAFLVVFREGIEAALLIAALLAGARRLGHTGASRFIHLGWIAALPAGVATWWAFEKLLAGAHRRELVEALVALTAATVLFSVSFWMISKAESRHWVSYLRRNLEATLNRRNLLLVAGLAFLAVYREAAETVLFLKAIVLEGGGAQAEVFAGLAVALVAVLVCAYLMNRAITRLPIGPFFAVSGVLLCLLAISFAGSGIHTLVSSGYLQARPVSFPEIPWMGIHPDMTSLLVQLAIVSTIAAGAWLTFRRRPLERAATRPDGLRR